MNILTSTIARYMYALPFGVFGILHLMNANAMAGMVPIPGGAFWIYVTGLAHLAACISILIEKKTKLACLLLGVMLLIFVLSIHIPSIIGDGEGARMSMTNLLKDTALAGAAWFIAGRYDDAESSEVAGGSEESTSREPYEGAGGGEQDY